MCGNMVEYGRPLRLAEEIKKKKKEEDRRNHRTKI